MLTIKTDKDGIHTVETPDGIQVRYLIEGLSEGDIDYMWVQISDGKQVIRIPAEIAMYIGSEVDDQVKGEWPE